MYMAYNHSIDHKMASLACYIHYQPIFYKLSQNTQGMLYVVIVSRYKGKWIFVRQKGKTTWEMPGGHIEEGEHVNDAGKRELMEETGAVDFNLLSICDFQVSYDDKGRSRLFFAEIEELGKLGDYEIEELRLCDVVPKNLTYENIQLTLLKKVKLEIKKNIY